jgi:GT2 family glycosyltransferase
MEKNEKIGILSPLIKKGDGKSVWFAGGEISWLRMRAQHTTKKDNEALSDTQYVTGCAMLIRKAVFKAIGLFDENFFLYYEDADLCLRAKKHGFRSAVMKNVTIKHFEKSQQNMEQKNYWLVISGLKFFKKNTPGIWRPWVTCYLLARKIKNSLDIFGGKNPMAIVVKKAYKDYIQWEKR